jgi:hypothetical protein
MKPPTPWLSRNWDYQIDPRLLPCILDRLAGSPARIEEKVANINPAFLTHKPNGKWSIQEHIGHLLDLEELGLSRIEDFRAKKPALRAWDMRNLKTEEGGYNSVPLDDLLAAFREEREKLVEAFWKLDDEALEWTALHPRLQKPMRVADFAHFHAEHDDHHLAAMACLANNLK